MATSTSTLLDAVNRVLLDVGERITIDLTRPAAAKAAKYVQEAFNDTQNFHDWEWLRQSQGVDSWSTDSATFNNVRRIRTVSWDTGYGYYDIPFIDIDSFNYLYITSFVGATSTATYPSWWTKADEDTIRLNPYPTDSTGQAKLKAQVIKYYDPPASTTSMFNCPERFVNLIVKRAVYMMFARHLGDLNTAQVMEGEFESLLATYRSKENGTSSEGWNMFRGSRYSA